MIVEQRELCSTCNNQSTCMYRKTRNHPIFFCEQFDPYVPVSGATVTKHYSPQLISHNNVKGLCSNCDNYKTCTLPKPEGGIWHCEEYR